MDRILIAVLSAMFVVIADATVSIVKDVIKSVLVNYICNKLNKHMTDDTGNTEDAVNEAD